MKFEQQPMSNAQSLSPYIIVSAIFLLLAYLPVMFLDGETIDSLTKEDSYYESLGAAFWLIASILFFVLFAKSKLSNHVYLTRTNRNVFFLLLGCLFFFAFGEEISWGQRIFGIETPEVLKEINAQDELNIHNIQIFHGKDAEGQSKGFLARMTNIDRLFSIFWFTYCFLVPSVYKKSLRAADFLNRLALPIVPLSIGSFFVLNYLVSKIIEWNLRSVVEIKESIFAFLFVVVAFWFIFNYRNVVGSAKMKSDAA